jgi:hypothetical protein
VRSRAVREIYGACVKTTRRLALLPQVETMRRLFALPRRWPRGNARISGMRWACVRAALTHRVGQDLEKAQKSNQHIFGSPELASGSCDLPIAHLRYPERSHD